MENKFESWALVELFGHKKIAGLVSEIQFGNQSMLRIDVPEVDQIPPFSKIVNVSSIYAINPLSRESAIEMAKKFKEAPIEKWDMEVMFKNRLEVLLERGDLMKPEIPETVDSENLEDSPC